VYGTVGHGLSQSAEYVWQLAVGVGDKDGAIVRLRGNAVQLVPVNDAADAEYDNDASRLS